MKLIGKTRRTRRTNSKPESEKVLSDIVFSGERAYLCIGLGHYSFEDAKENNKTGRNYEDLHCNGNRVHNR